MARSEWVGWSGGSGGRRSGNLVFPSQFGDRQRGSTWPLRYPGHPCDGSRSDCATRVPRSAGKKLRACRTGGLIHNHRHDSGFRVSHTGVPLFSDVGIEWLVPVGVLGSLVGLVLYGAATLQARVLPRWCGILFIVFMPIGLLLGDFQPIWGGLVWVGLGYALLLQSSGAAPQQPSRVR